MPFSLLALSLSTFAIGTTEFVIVGLIPEMALDLGVGVPTAGLLVSLYALSVTIGTPIFTALTARFPRRGLVIALMVIFALCNLGAALAPNYGLLLAARMLMGVAHGVFFGVGTAMAASLVDKSRAGRAMAMMIGGVTLAMVTGVPFGTWVGQLFGWRMPFFIVTALGTLSFLSLLVFLPRKVAPVPQARFLAQLALLGNGRLLGMYAITALGFGATFVVFTFLSPLLTDITGVDEAVVSLALVLFGGASIIGNFVGGRLIDAIGVRAAMTIVLVGLVVSLAAIPFTVWSLPGILLNMLVWGSFAFAVPPIMQSAVVAVAQEEVPNAVSTASGFNIAAINLGIASGSFIGGRLIGGPGLLSTPFASIAMALIALVLVFVFTAKPKPAGQMT